MISGVATVILLVVLVAGLSISWTQLRGAPWVPSPMKRVRTMLRLADVRPGEVVYDLGCGDGRTIVAAAREFGARAVGIEVDPLRYIWCQVLVTVLGERSRIRVLYGDFFEHDLGDADVVACYLLPETNQKLQAKLSSELRRGARVVSHAFTFPAFRLLDHDPGDNVYLYDMEIGDSTD